jgi:hypothetical protein
MSPESLLAEDVLTRAIRRDLGPILQHLIKGLQPRACDKTLWNRLRGADLMARLYSARLTDAALDIAAFGQAQGQSVTMLKGMSTSVTLYPAAHLRPMGDIDILVQSEALPMFEQMLKRCGYQERSRLPPEFYRSHHHAMPLFHPEKQVWIELHTALVRPTSPSARDYVFSQENIFSNLVTRPHAGFQLSHLRPELALVHLCTHLVEDTKWDRAVFAILDLALLLRHHAADIDWERVNSWLRGTSAIGYVAPLLSYLLSSGFANDSRTDKGFPVQRGALTDRAVEMLIHKIIDRYIVEGERFGAFRSEPNITNIWTTLFRQNSSRQKLTLLPWNLMFPPGHPDRFRITFQLSRIRSLFRSASDRTT